MASRDVGLRVVAIVRERFLMKLLKVLVLRCLLIVRRITRYRERSLSIILKNGYRQNVGKIGNVLKNVGFGMMALKVKYRRPPGEFRGDEYERFNI